MYIIHCAYRLSQVGASLLLLSMGCLSCLVICPPCHCCQVGLVVHHPHCHCCPWAVCPVGALSSVPHIIVVVIIVHGPVVLWRPHPCCYLVGFIICSPHCHHRCPHPLLLLLSSGGHIIHPPLLALSSLSSMDHLSCRGLLVVAVQWGFVVHSPCHCCRPFPTSSSSAVPHIVIVVVCRPFDLWRHCCCCCSVGALSSVLHIVVTSHPPQHRCHHCPQAIWPAEALLLLLSSGVPCHPFPMLLSPAVPHIVIVVVIHGPFDLWRPCCCCCLVGCLVVRFSRCCHLWAICPVEALSLSLSGGRLVILVILVVLVHRPFVLRRPHHCCCPMGASSSLSSSSSEGLIVVVVVMVPHWLSLPHHCCHPAGALSSSMSSLLLLLLSILKRLRWHNVPAWCSEQQSLWWVSDLPFFVSRSSGWQWGHVKGRHAWNSMGTVVSMQSYL